MTFTLDEGTAKRIDATALRLGIPKSRVVREAVAEYGARVGRLSDEERERVLTVFDEYMARIPKRLAAEADRELAEIRRGRRLGGRRTRTESGR